MEGGAKRKSRKKEHQLPRNIQKMDEDSAPTPAKMAGAGATSPGTMVQLAATHVPGSSSAHVAGIGSNLTASGALVGLQSPAAPTGPVGGAKPQHVILNKTKKKGLVLAPKVAVAVVPNKRRKTAKKFHVSVGGLTRKLHKAKIIRAKADKHTIADVKKELVAAGLIKADSKAPEPILRQIYSDFMVLKKRAL
jgi:hypothetical protein